ncbi:TolC family outer membrane protein [Aquisalimonas sp. APHAB1-3]|uniref:TolC family outer membrane protein n=1 Tax=Aquisalimonas sp. APHAB1-3 TaxID=3402080 RepID=UPI003AAD7D2C
MASRIASPRSCDSFGILAVILSLVVTFSTAPAAAEPTGLLDVYEDALSADTQLQASESGVSAAREREREALGAWLPSLSATAGVDRVRRDERGGAGDDGARTFTREQYQIRLEQPIYNRRHWVRLRQSERETRRSDLERSSEHQDVMARVTDAYFEVLLAQLENGLAEREVEALSSEVRRVEALYDRGLASRADRLEVQAALEEARNEKLGGQHRVDAAFEHLREITNRRYAALRPLKDEFPVERPEPDNVDVWVDRAMQNNPRLMAAEEARLARRDQIAIERAEHHPRLSLVASHTYFDDVDDEEELPLAAPGRRFDETVVGVQLTVPLYEGGQVSARSRAAEHDVAQASQQVDGLRRALLSEVRGSFLDVDRGATSIRALERSVSAQTARLEAVEEELQIGRRSVVDLLETRRALIESRLSLAQARVEYLRAHVSLRSAAGELDRESVLWLAGFLE